MEDCRGEGGVVGVGAGRGGGVRGRERAHAPPLGRCGTARGRWTHHAALLALGHLSALLEDVHRGEGIGDHGSLRARVRATAVSEERRSPKGGGARAEALKRRCVGTSGLATQAGGVALSAKQAGAGDRIRR